MKSKSFAIFLLILVFLLPACKEPVKEPSVAGSFYPEDGNTLEMKVGDFLSKAENKPFEGRLIALISPHAGYRFSGHVAAYGYKNLIGKDIKTVILIGPSHHSSFTGASVYTEGSFKTPLGNIKINERLAKSLINESANVGFYKEPYLKEHSLEVQLPFLKKVLNGFKVVPILIGNPTRQTFDHLSQRLTEALSKDEKAIIVASTDLSHYHDYKTAVSMDKKMTDAIEALSLRDAEERLMKGEAEMCGAYPVLLTMDTARRLGANYAALFKYANSGDVTGDKGRVVGYASIGIFKSPLTEREKAELLSLAEKTIKEYVKSHKENDMEINNPKLKSMGAVFVTINTNGHLRGCIGHIEPIMPLYKSVIRNAIAASSSDPRFPPMNDSELKDMEVEITILSPLSPLKEIKDIKIGRDGIYMTKGQNGAIFLPQVPLQFGWDRDTYLKELSLKAGLPPDAWKEGATLYTFTAEIIR
jgi:AmmeMemoRadiSam system protein B/AmmeMemoRadiSam system protein A